MRANTGHVSYVTKQQIFSVDLLQSMLSEDALDLGKVRRVRAD